MLKKTIIFILFIGIILFSFDIINAAGPKIECKGLPGCETGDAQSVDTGKNLISGIVAQLIQYTAVVAVIALMLSGMLYLVSGGEEEKVKKAKNWIIWSLVGVLVSISAMGIIQAINSIGFDATPSDSYDNQGHIDGDMSGEDYSEPLFESLTEEEEAELDNN